MRGIYGRRHMKKSFTISTGDLTRAEIAQWREKVADMGMQECINLREGMHRGKDARKKNVRLDLAMSGSMGDEVSPTILAHRWKVAVLTERIAEIRRGKTVGKE